MTAKSPDLSSKKEATRADFRSYWTDEHGAPTLENMMLDSNAATMDVLERPEILAELPSLNSKTILELGAGIGRFSSALAEKAEKVISVDFVDASCKINRETNSKYTNLEVVCEDALKLSFPPNSFDIVFSNWLLMYLSDEEVQTLATNCLNWLKPGGRIFFRESCFHRSGNAPRRWNPTIYRDPRTYFKFFNAARGTADGGSRFQLCKTSCVHAYVRMKNNPNQVWWIWEKCTSGHLIRYLDTQQYDYNSVFRYEQLYGSGFISTGGKELIEDITSKLTMTRKLAGSRVLDVGCGLGGNMLHFASLGCFVHGIDISGVMVSIASERYLKMPADIQQKMSISVGDVFDSNFIPNSFDIICCRDFLMHFSESDKRILLTKFSRWLAPGGSVILTDYTALSKAQPDMTRLFSSYLNERNYHLVQREQFESMLSTSGFQFASTDQVAGMSFASYLTKQLEEYEKFVEEKKVSCSESTMKLDQGRIFDSVFSAVKEVVDSEEELALIVAQASADLTSKFIQEKKDLIAEEEDNLKWVKKYWDIKIQAASQNELGYCVYIASRSD